MYVTTYRSGRTERLMQVLTYAIGSGPWSARRQRPAATRRSRDRGVRGSRLAGARTGRIARSAGVNEALLFRYFGNKQELFELVYDRLVKQAVENVVLDAGDLPGYAGALFDFYDRDAEVLRPVDLGATRAPRRGGVHGGAVVHGGEGSCDPGGAVGGQGVVAPAAGRAPRRDRADLSRWHTLRHRSCRRLRSRAASSQHRAGRRCDRGSLTPTTARRRRVPFVGILTRRQRVSGLGSRPDA